MAGGTLGIVSTAWAEEGLLWTLVTKNLGVPGSELTGKHETALACITPTELLRQDPQIKADIAIARATDPESAAREFDCIPLAKNTSAFFGSGEIKEAVQLGTGLGDDLAPPSNASVGVGIDTGLVTDSSALVAVHLQDRVYTVARVIERQPSRGNPLKLSQVCAEYLQEMRRQRCYRATADQYEFEASKEYLSGIELLPAPTGLAGKSEAYTFVRQLIREGKLRIPAGHTKLITQLGEVVSKPAEGGKLRIWSPRNKGGHGDLVSALVNACWQLHESSGSMWDALRVWQEREQRGAA
jgi:hypothetical protein